MSRNDGRGRIVELRELCKQWSLTDLDHRVAMIEKEPTRCRWYHRFTARRHDLARIAAVIHAMCDRDGVPVPDWVWKHRCRRAIGLTKSIKPASPWGRLVCSDAPAACATHNVWFDQTAIENITVHGFRESLVVS